MKLFDKRHDANILLENPKDETILLATRDLQKNLRRLSGKSDGFNITDNYEGQGVLIKTVPSENPESYTVKVLENEVQITGSDSLGTVYGIYAFATKCLHILPFYRLVDLFPAQTESFTLEEQCFVSAPRPVRFRGWFLNDEDLLTEFKISGGKRNIDYKFYDNVMDVSVLDMILETALRMEINLIIPSSFVDIDNPDEEKLVETVCRRGLYVSQHHVEPMGVSYFGADNYLKKRGYDSETISFLTNRNRMVEIWQYYAEKWAKYGSHVIWQLGLRGKADQAVWNADPSIPNSVEIRGQIITDAIKTQYDIVCHTLGTDAFHSTATLWNEGSELYGKGLLKLPERTIPVISDLGLDQMFGKDLDTIKVYPNKKFGVYYHICYWTRGPHLTEGCHPEKMAYCYRLATESGDLCYSILNVSNVRPVHFSAFLNAKLLSSPSSFDMPAEMLDFDEKMFGEQGKEVNGIRRNYYGCFADFGETPLKNFAETHCFYYRPYENLGFIRNVTNDGQLTYFGKYLLMHKSDACLPPFNEETRLILENSAKKFHTLYKKAEKVESLMTEERRLYFDKFLKYQIRHMELLSEWCVGCLELSDDSRSIEQRLTGGYRACSCLQAILEERKVLESGEWKNWHRGDKKIDIVGLIALTQKTIEEIKK